MPRFSVLSKSNRQTFSPQMNADQRRFFGKSAGRCIPHLLTGVFGSQNRVCPPSLLAEIELGGGLAGGRKAVSGFKFRVSKTTAKPSAADRTRINADF